VARFFFLLFLVVSLFGCDHATKMAAKASLENNAAVPLGPDALNGAFELRYVENRDIAFNAFTALGLPHSPELLAGIGVAVVVVLVATIAAAALRRRRDPEQGPGVLGAQIGFALILGGALGNIVDRLARGYVVDFIHVKGWPIFNVADIAVVVGVALLVRAGLQRRPPASA
jgi:signal peptidase II